MNAPEIQKRLIKLIKNLSEVQQKNLLDYFEAQQIGYRKNPRKECFLATDYTIQDQSFKNFIKNISASGVYITIPQPQAIGQEVSMNFRLADFKDPVRVYGKIVRSGPKGFAVEFYKGIEELLNNIEMEVFA